MSDFTWETYVPERDIKSTSITIVLLKDLKDFKPNNDDENSTYIYFSLDFEKTEFFENYFLIKENPRLFFEFKSTLSTRNKLAESFKNYERTYISYIHDSIYELAYMVRDIDHGVKYQVIGLNQPMTIYNPFYLEPFHRPVLQKDIDELEKMIVELVIYNANIGHVISSRNMSLPEIARGFDGRVVDGMFNIHGYVISFIIMTYGIYSSENKSIEDIFYDNRDIRDLIFSKIPNIVKHLIENGVVKIDLNQTHNIPNFYTTIK